MAQFRLRQWYCTQTLWGRCFPKIDFIHVVALGVDSFKHTVEENTNAVQRSVFMNSRSKSDLDLTVEQFKVMYIRHNVRKERHGRQMFQFKLVENIQHKTD